jgi:uncharacterized protein (TIGR02266 family)
VEHRRADRRYDRRLDIQVTFDGTTFSAHSRNISLGGVYLMADRPMRFGAKVTLRFQVNTQTEAIEVDGEVRWVEAVDDAGTHGVGVQFGGLRARDVWALNKFFEKPAE